MASLRSASTRPPKRTNSPPPYPQIGNQNSNNPNLLFSDNNNNNNKPKTLFPIGTTLELPRQRNGTSRRNVPGSSRAGGGGGGNSETESNASTSRLHSGVGLTRREKEDLIELERKELKTNSPLRILFNWLKNCGQISKSLSFLILITVYFKFLISLGGYSGLGTPPMRGDFEAQRHWLALTSSSLSLPFLQPVPTSIPISQWYSYDLSYWGLDYPPLTAYHSLFLGTLARLSKRTSQYVTLRPLTTSSPEILEEWDKRMEMAELEGGMKSWMRGTVLGSDLLIWVSAVVVFCRINYSKGNSPEKKLQTVAVAALSILLQPSLLLIDSGHFQYNSVMLGLTLWSVNLFQTSHDLLGASVFVCALCFKQMSLYYSPAIFAYLLGKCFYLGGRPGFSHLLNIGFITALTFLLLFAPFLSPISSLLQALHRIFPFARGLFEDKVANFWCVLNLVIKLKEWGSIGLLGKAALGLTVLAVLPSTIGVIWVSMEIGKRERVTLELISESSLKDEKKDSSQYSSRIEGPAPTIVLLPHALFLSSMAFFLFSFQVHEKSILLPLMPLTILMGTREVGLGRFDWEWAVLLNNIGVFSMWPLLKKDGLGVQYVFLTLFWNFIIGYNPLTLERSFVKYLSLISYFLILLLHTLELVASPPSHLPDLFPVLNLVLSAGVFGLSFLWASKRSLQESWAVVGMSGLMEPRSRNGNGNGSERRRSSGNGGGGGGGRSVSGRSVKGDKKERESRSGRSESGMRGSTSSGHQSKRDQQQQQQQATASLAPPSISSRMSVTGSSQQQQHQQARSSSSRQQNQPPPPMPYSSMPPSSYHFSQPQQNQPQASSSSRSHKANSTTGAHHSLSQSQPPSSYPSSHRPNLDYGNLNLNGSGSVFNDNNSLGHGNPGVPRSRQRVESVMGRSTNGGNGGGGSVSGSRRVSKDF